MDNIKTKQSVVGHLRRLTPRRPLQAWEARRVAELQAARLRKLCGDTAPAFDTDHIRELPRVEVVETTAIAEPGQTQYLRDRLSWSIAVRGDEPLVRQRFTLAHEFKHVLDGGLPDYVYGPIRQRIDAHAQIEDICDYFAACLLMPKRWVKRLWGEGIQDLDLLAHSFDVSRAAMLRRLRDLKLIDNQARPINATDATSSTANLSGSSEPRWQRASLYTCGRGAPAWSDTRIYERRAA